MTTTLRTLRKTSLKFNREQAAVIDRQQRIFSMKDQDEKPSPSSFSLFHTRNTLVPNNDPQVSWGQGSREKCKEVTGGTACLPTENGG